MGPVIIVGAAGYVARRHFAAVRSAGGVVVAAHDVAEIPADVRTDHPGVVCYPDLRDALNRYAGTNGGRAPVVSVCSPNHLHKEHIRMALLSGFDVFCEKPVVVDPAELDGLRALEAQTGKRVFGVLQLRHHIPLIDVRQQVLTGPRKRHVVELDYVTMRDASYFATWKGREDLSGGIAVNIGIHFFDLLLWMFGPVRAVETYERDTTVISGMLELERADVRWFLSTEQVHLPPEVAAAGGRMHRSITVDGRALDFSTYGVDDLHTIAYRELLAGRGFGLDEVEPSIRLAHRIRTEPLVSLDADVPELAVSQVP